MLTEAMIEAVDRAAEREMGALKKYWKKLNDAVYHERDQLVAALSKVYFSHISPHQPEDDKNWDDDWRNVICIHIPVPDGTTQVAWHVHDSEMGLFKHLTAAPGHYDGHSTEEKYKRLAEIDPQK